MAENHEKSQGLPIKKKVDESWKNSVDKEKLEPSPNVSGTSAQPLDPEFPFFISSLGMQALVALGEMPDPVSKEKGLDLANAKYLIDTIQMLSQKTKNNLSKEEESMLQGLLYELQIKFVEKSRAA